MEILQATKDVFENVLEVAIDNLPSGTALRLYQGVKVTHLPHHVSKTVSHLWHELVTVASITVTVHWTGSHHGLESEDVWMGE